MPTTAYARYVRVETDMGLSILQSFLTLLSIPVDLGDSFSFENLRSYAQRPSCGNSMGSLEASMGIDEDGEYVALDIYFLTTEEPFAAFRFYRDSAYAFFRERDRNTLPVHYELRKAPD